MHPEASRPGHPATIWPAQPKARFSDFRNFTVAADSVESAVRAGHEVGDATRHELGPGEASYYGDELVGNPTASGEAFDPDGLTAAHRTLPLGSIVRVTNARNGKTVVVRINDRGPWLLHRVIDLSEEAARRIGMVRAGTATVHLEILR